MSASEDYMIDNLAGDDPTGTYQGATVDDPVSSEDILAADLDQQAGISEQAGEGSRNGSDADEAEEVSVLDELKAFLAETGQSEASEGASEISLFEHAITDVPNLITNQLVIDQLRDLLQRCIDALKGTDISVIDDDYPSYHELKQLLEQSLEQVCLLAPESTQDGASTRMDNSDSYNSDIHGSDINNSDAAGSQSLNDGGDGKEGSSLSTLDELDRMLTDLNISTSDAYSTDTNIGDTDQSANSYGMPESDLPDQETESADMGATYMEPSDMGAVDMETDASPADVNPPVQDESDSDSLIREMGMLLSETPDMEAGQISVYPDALTDGSGGDSLATFSELVVESVPRGEQERDETLQMDTLAELEAMLSEQSSASEQESSVSILEKYEQEPVVIDADLPEALSSERVEEDPVRFEDGLSDSSPTKPGSGNPVDAQLADESTDIPEDDRSRLPLVRWAVIAGLVGGGAFIWSLTGGEPESNTWRAPADNYDAAPSVSEAERETGAGVKAARKHVEIKKSVEVKKHVTGSGSVEDDAVRPSTQVQPSPQTQSEPASDSTVKAVAQIDKAVPATAIIHQGISTSEYQALLETQNRNVRALKDLTQRVSATERSVARLQAGKLNKDSEDVQILKTGGAEPGDRLDSVERRLTVTLDQLQVDNEPDTKERAEAHVPVTTVQYKPGSWYVHIASYYSKPPPENELVYLDKAEVPYEIRKADVNGDTWYRVLVNNFSEYGQAKSYSDKMRVTLGIDDVWVSQNPTIP